MLHQSQHNDQSKDWFQRMCFKKICYDVQQRSDWLHTDEALAIADCERQVVLDDAEVAETVRCAPRELGLCPTVVILQAVANTAVDALMKHVQHFHAAHLTLPRSSSVDAK